MNTLSHDLRQIIDRIDAKTFFTYTLIGDPFHLFVDPKSIDDTTSTIHGLYLKLHTSVCHSLSLKHDIDQSISSQHMRMTRYSLNTYLKTEGVMQSFKGAMKTNIEKYDDFFIEDLSRLLASYKKPGISFELVFRDNISGISYRETDKESIYTVNFVSRGFKQPLTIELRYVFDIQNTRQKNVLLERHIREMIPGSNGQFHGQGIRTHYNRYGKIEDQYVGTWKNGEHHGQGMWTRYTEDGTILSQYVGAFENNKYHGQGIQTWYTEDGTIRWKYVGEYHDNTLVAMNMVRDMVRGH